MRYTIDLSELRRQSLPSNIIEPNKLSVFQQALFGQIDSSLRCQVWEEDKTQALVNLKKAFAGQLLIQDQQNHNLPERFDSDESVKEINRFRRLCR